MAYYRFIPQAPDRRRELFRRYLEKHGVTDSLASVFVALFKEPERPNNALEFVRQHLGATGQISADTEALQQEVMDLRQKWERLTAENRDLKTRLQRHEPLPEDGATAE